MRVRVPPPAPSGDQVSESGWSWARAVYPARESLFGGRHHRYLLSARLLGAASRRERAHLPARRGRGGRRLSGLPSLPPLPVAAVNELHRPGVGLPGSASDPRWRARGGLRHSVSLDQLISSITEFGGLGSGTAHYVALRLGEPPTRPRRPANLSSAGGRGGRWPRRTSGSPAARGKRQSRDRVPPAGRREPASRVQHARAGSADVQTRARRRREFDRIFREGALPMLHRFGIEVVGYGPSIDDGEVYYLMRVFPSAARREEQLDSFYGSDEWRQNHRDAVLALIETYHTVVIELPQTGLL